MPQKKRKLKRGAIIPVALLVVFIGIGFFFQFSSIGYRMTVPYRNFDEVQDNVYVDDTYSGDKDEVIEIINEATDRVSQFWGEIEASPIVIVSDNISTLSKLGGDHDTTRIVFFGAHSYISISDEYLNVDIVAHELTHAELYERLYKGKIFPKTLIPMWFDEGVATQNDYRKQYGEEAWQEKTESGANVIALNEMDTAAKFYAGDVEDRRFRYLISRHEVKGWIDRNGINSLLELIDQINKGTDFYGLYTSK